MRAPPYQSVRGIAMATIFDDGRERLIGAPQPPPPAGLSDKAGGDGGPFPALVLRPLAFVVVCPKPTSPLQRRLNYASVVVGADRTGLRCGNCRGAWDSLGRLKRQLWCRQLRHATILAALAANFSQYLVAAEEHPFGDPFLVLFTGPVVAPRGGTCGSNFRAAGPFLPAASYSMQSASKTSTTSPEPSSLILASSVTQTTSSSSVRPVASSTRPRVYCIRVCVSTTSPKRSPASHWPV